MNSVLPSLQGFVLRKASPCTLRRIDPSPKELHTDANDVRHAIANAVVFEKKILQMTMMIVMTLLMMTMCC